MKPEIHATAIVHPEAVIGEGTRIGAFSVVDAKVRIGKNCFLREHTILRDYTTIGDNADIHPFAVIGGDPQHLRYKGEPTTVQIGDRVTIRESVTVHRGTPFGNGTTVIKDDVYLMAYCHVAHDCVIGEKAIFANAVQLAGHVTIGKSVVVGGLTGITQFCSVGDYAFIGANSVIRKDIPPYLAGKGAEFQVQGVNSIGLERNGFSEDVIRNIKKFYKFFYVQKLTISQAIEKTAVELGGSKEADYFVSFLRQSKLGVVR
jgi:UDP-N-acetylglucosamine acyltransferase